MHRYIKKEELVQLLDSSNESKSNKLPLFIGFCFIANIAAILFLGVAIILRLI